MNTDTNNKSQIKVNTDLEGLDAKEIWKVLYNKDLNSKKNILEYISITKVLKQDNITSEQIQGTYTLIYNSIEELGSIIKVNTIMYLKNQLKAQLGKYVKEKDPKPINYFIEFFKEAYPANARRKDFTWVLIDINKITEEQIWTTLTYINRCCLKDDITLNADQKKDIIKVIKLLVNKNNIKYINQVKSLEKLLNVLNIKIVTSDDGFQVRNK
ncbi:hypothetical protein CPJCM30710_30990 [Clostridium polyendosporum]|uniref:Uncharacterized protein n=1 Tax=Clostridium polyendosporum TaxID=69208 RepID=A0A919S3A7_9CLOT|nr:hypothetical protein [Clostridium polyendosporum]GIM30433.1 hypothetical protein CPJCM30710_30990 [Clostridium polyendosporum]